MDTPFNHLKHCRHGQFLFNVNDRFIGKSLDLYGEWKEAEIQLFRHIIKPGHVVLDVGSNIGPHTLFFAQAVGLEGAVFAFEPQRLFFQTLCANMALNQVVRAYCYHAAVGETPGSIPVPVRMPWLKDFNFSALPLREHYGDDCEAVPLITIDSLELTRCHFIKVEVVGMELEVLKGAERTIIAHRPFLYVENDLKGHIGPDGKPVIRPDNQEKSDTLIRHIDALGYDMFWHVALYFNPANFLKNPENVFDNTGAVNMLCVPRNRGHNITALPKVIVPGPVGK